jgi:hypothetical protein
MEEVEESKKLVLDGSDSRISAQSKKTRTGFCPDSMPDERVKFFHFFHSFLFFQHAVPP